MSKIKYSILAFIDMNWKILLFSIFLVSLVLLSTVYIKNPFPDQKQNSIEIYHSSVTQKNLVIIDLFETIDPGSASMITGALSGLNSNSTAAVVICMNTPGGYLTSMLQMVTNINQTESLKIPVYTYIVPDGLGASAGSYVAMASDSIWMGPGSEIGPSTPIVVGGTSLEENHTLNGMEALMSSLAQAHGRNVTEAANMVYNDVALTSSQAFSYRISNGIATNFSAFLAANNLSSYSKATVSESYYDQFLSFLSNSITDGILISIGSLAILLDLYHRTAFLTLVGLVMIILGLLGAQLIDASLVGIAMLIIGSALIFMEFKTSHGIALISGITVDLFGTFLLVSPQYDITYSTYAGAYSPSPISSSFFVIGAILIVLGLFLAYYLHRIIRSQIGKPTTGWESLINSRGIADTDIGKEGWVSIDGVRWKAIPYNNERIEKGETIVVIGIKNLTLTVRKDGGNE